MSVPTVRACCGESAPGEPAPGSGWLPAEMRRVVRNEACPGFGFSVWGVSQSRLGNYSFGFSESPSWNCVPPYPEPAPHEWYHNYDWFSTLIHFPSCGGGGYRESPFVPETSYGGGCGVCLATVTACSATSITTVGEYCGSTTQTVSSPITPEEMEGWYPWVTGSCGWTDDPEEWGACAVEDAYFFDRRHSSFYDRKRIRIAVKMFPTSECFPIRVCASAFTVNLKAVFSAYIKGYDGVETLVGEHDELFSLTVSEDSIPDADWHAWSDVLEIDPEEGTRLQFLRVEIVE